MMKFTSVGTLNFGNCCEGCSPDPGFCVKATTPTPRTTSGRATNSRERGEGERPDTRLISSLQQKLKDAKTRCDDAQTKFAKCRKKVKSAQKCVDDPDSDDDSDDLADNQKTLTKALKKLSTAKSALDSQKIVVADLERQIVDAGGEVPTGEPSPTPSPMPSRSPSPTQEAQPGRGKRPSPGKRPTRPRADDEKEGEPPSKPTKPQLSLGRALVSVGRNGRDLESAPCDETGIKCYYIPVRRIGQIDEKNKAIVYSSDLDRRFGSDPFSKRIPEKVVLVVGATGAGKSTLINGLINFMFGVQFADDCRFKLIREDETVNKEAFKLSKEERQSMSQTDYTTIYRVGCYDMMAHKFRLTIIDTPGFGDTRGIKRDQLIVENLAHVIDERRKFGINHLNYIAFVLPSNQGRLTPTMKYISSSILAMFGKDLHDSILPCLTFSDGGKSNAVNALKVDGVPFNEYCKFQNSAIYQKSKDDPFQAQMQNMYWQIGNANFEKMVSLCDKKQAIPLEMTCDVAKQKRMIDANMYHVMNLLKVVALKKNEMAAKQVIISKFEAEIISGKKNMKIDVPYSEGKFFNCPSGKYVTHCTVCQTTCHKWCYLDPNEDKKGCGAMGSNGQCRNCVSKCHWSKHRNFTQYVEVVSGTRTTTCKEMADKYAKGLSGKAKFEGILSGLQKEIDDAMDMQAVCVEKLRKSRNRLQEIAMRPDPLSSTEYLDSLIKLEEMNKAKQGWETRKQNLVDLKTKVAMEKKIMATARKATKGRKAPSAATSSWTLDAIGKKIASWLPFG